MKKIYIGVALLTLTVIIGCDRKPQPAATQAPAVPPQKTEAPAQPGTAQAAAAAEVIEQTTCPVMAGSPIDKSLFVEYKGKKVYFCCNSCVEEFNKDPEKYIKDLPQFKK